MQSVNIVRSSPVVQTPRVKQLCGMFDVPPSERSETSWQFEFELPETWDVGSIIGPSGSGKTTLAREVFGNGLVSGFDWPADKAIVDGFPAAMGIKDVTGLLSSVGFSSPPSWLRPFGVLSNGEQFRVTIARALAESPALAVIDEFTSVVDRTVAQIGSAAVAKAVRRSGRKLIAVTCHYDVLDWLDPDWVIEMPAGTLTRRSLQGRPKIRLEIRRVHHSAWKLFGSYHYLNTELSTGSICFVAFYAGRPVAFSSVLPHLSKYSGWREHRTVCLPEYQGVGIGNAVSEFVAGLMVTSKPFYSTTGSPSMIRHRCASPLWIMRRSPSIANHGLTSKMAGSTVHGKKNAPVTTRALDRLTCGFAYCGPALPEHAAGFGLQTKSG